MLDRTNNLDDDIPLNEKGKTGANNDTMAAPALEIRVQISNRWTRILSLLQEFNIQEKQGMTTKILACAAMTSHMRREISRIMSHDLPERARTGELAILLEKTECDIARIEDIRNALYQENSGLVVAFFHRKKYKGYYAETFDLETRKQLASEGLLRAADTFDPSRGKLSTYAFFCIKSAIRQAAEQNSKHTTTSLDVTFGHGEESAGSLLSTLPDHSAEDAHIAEERREMAEALHVALATLPVQWKRSLELLYGVTPDRNTYSPREAAQVMHEEGLRTISKGAVIQADKVKQWAQLAKREIAKQMVKFKPLKTGGEDEALA